ATLRGRGRRLTRLGNRSLGEVLFSDPTVTRGAVEVARVGPASWLHQRAWPGPRHDLRPLWGRRSLFWLAGRPLLVCELFLPDLPVSFSQPLPDDHGPSTT
ncbi:MAG: chorismate lyase, partial [Candidatus Competibacteraceae bacterium]|nr:chorismate lyase [Candidatus Competibacteraceae bacterium]